jgi:hypothetical protein
MTDAAKTPAAGKGFSSRWILDGDRRDGSAVAGDARTSANAIDTDGDGVADTLALRVDAEPRRSAMQSLGAWIGRSIVTIVFVAALVAAAIAATTALNAREQLDVAKADLVTERTQLVETRADLEEVQAKLLAAERASGTAAVDVTRLETERDELELEVRVLRRMLLDAERRGTSE